MIRHGNGCGLNMPLPSLHGYRNLESVANKWDGECGLNTPPLHLCGHRKVLLMNKTVGVGKIHHRCVHVAAGWCWHWVRWQVWVNMLPLCSCICGMVLALSEPPHSCGHRKVLLTNETAGKIHRRHVHVAVGWCWHWVRQRVWVKYTTTMLVHPRMVLGLSEAAGVGEIHRCHAHVSAGWCWDWVRQWVWVKYATAMLVYPWDGGGIEWGSRCGWIRHCCARVSAGWCWHWVRWWVWVKYATAMLMWLWESGKDGQ